jgi:hypothetical protein
MFPNLAGDFQISGCGSLTAVTHTASTQTFTRYTLSSCDITGTHDLTHFSGLSGTFQMNSNSNLTGINHDSNTSGVFTTYDVSICDLTGDFDISMLTGLGGTLDLSSNSNMTNIAFPLTTQSFDEILLYSCDLNYVDIHKISGGTSHGVSIQLQNNNMVAGDVNHYLYTFDETGWTGGTLVIDGTNAAPDTTAGGYDGIAAIGSLTGASKSWTVTTN